MADNEQSFPLLGTEGPSDNDMSHDKSQSPHTAILLTLGVLEVLPPQTDDPQLHSGSFGGDCPSLLWRRGMGALYGLLAVLLLLFLSPSVPTLLFPTDDWGTVAEFLMWPVMAMSIWAWPAMFGMGALLLNLAGQGVTPLRVGCMLPWLWLTWTAAVFLLFVLVNL